MYYENKELTPTLDRWPIWSSASLSSAYAGEKQILRSRYRFQRCYHVNMKQAQIGVTK